MPYAFQIYSLFVANSSEITQDYQVIVDSILKTQSNWDKNMKYVIPAFVQYVIAMTYKHPQVIRNYTENI